MSSDAPPASESFRLWTTVILSFLPPFVALSAITAFPLHWAPGQIPLVIVVLFLASLLAALMERQPGERVGPAARSHLQRRIAVTVGWGAALVAIPALTWRTAHAGGGWLPRDLELPVALSIALLLLALAIAPGLARTWQELAPQSWEVRRRLDDADQGEAGRVDRGALVGAVWRTWIAGAVLLAGALAATELAPAGGLRLATPWGVIGLVAYCAAGLTALGHATQLRWGTQWRLEGVRVAPAVRSGWGRAIALSTVATLALSGLFLAFGALQAAHALVAWGWTVLLPVLNALLGFFSHAAGAPSPHLGNIFEQAPRHPAPMQAGRTGGGRPPGIWLWLTGHWLLLAALVALAIAVALVRTHGVPLQRGFWRALARDLLRELRLLWLLLWRAVHRGAGRAAVTAASGARAAMGRRSRRRQPIGNADPRELVIALYLSMVAEAARRGHARTAAQTPFQYRDRLAAAVPDGAGEVRELTDLFVRVRYGAAAVSVEQVGHARALWRALQRTLRRARRRSAGA